MHKLVIPPNQSQYSGENGNGCLAVKLDGGFSRYRRDVDRTTILVNTTWTVGPDEYNYLQAFYRVHGKGADPFLISLILESSGLTEYTAHFVPGSFKTPVVAGLSYQVSAQLEVEPQTEDTNYDLAIVTILENSIDSTLILALSNLVNNWPTTAQNNSEEEPIDLAYNFGS